MKRALSWRWFSLFAGLLLSLFVFTTSAAADEPMPVVDPACSAGDSLLSLDAECLGAAPPTPSAAAAASPTSPVRLDDSLPPNCRLHAEAIFWTASDWELLAEELAGNRSPCADYYISIPPLAANKTGLRVLQDDVIRALGPRIHPVAEVTLGGATGWAAWVAAVPGRTWFGAGVEFRKRMAAAGYRFDLGETWLLNEFDRSTRRDESPYTRAAMKDLVRGLYYGDGTGPTVPGIVEIGIAYTHQNIPDVEGYKSEMEAWLQDSDFWSAVDPYISVLTKEVYPDMRYWGVAGTSRNDRTRHLTQYMEHVMNLVEGRPRRDRSSPGAVRPRLHAARERNLGGKRAGGARPLPDSVLLRPRLDADAARDDADVRVGAGVRRPSLRRQPPAGASRRPHRLLVAAVEQPSSLSSRFRRRETRDRGSDRCGDPLCLSARRRLAGGRLLAARQRRGLVPGSRRPRRRIHRRLGDVRALELMKAGGAAKSAPPIDASVATSCC